MLSIFRHADIWHLIVNLVVLAIVGQRVRGALGWWRFTALFLLAGILANVSSAELLDRPVIGASGGVAAVMAAHFVLAPRARLGNLQTAPLIVLWITLQFLFAALSLDFAGIAWPAHIIGFVLGLLLTRFRILRGA